MTNGNISGTVQTCLCMIRWSQRQDDRLLTDSR